MPASKTLLIQCQLAAWSLEHNSHSGTFTLHDIELPLPYIKVYWSQRLFQNNWGTKAAPTNHSRNTYVKFSGKPRFISPNTHTYVCVSGGKKH